MQYYIQMSIVKKIQHYGIFDKNTELAQRIKYLRKNILKFSQKILKTIY